MSNKEQGNATIPAERYLELLEREKQLQTYKNKEYVNNTLLRDKVNTLSSTLSQCKKDSTKEIEILKKEIERLKKEVERLQEGKFFLFK